MEQKETFRSISIKAELVDDIEELMRRTDRYRSLAEFVSEAIRLRLEELQSKFPVKEA